MKFAAFLFSMLWLSIVQAKKIGNDRRTDTDPNVVNPDPEAGKLTLGFGRSPPQYNNELFEGDILPVEVDEWSMLPIRRYSVWPEKTVPYELHGQISIYMKSKIELAISDFANFTCVKFVPRNNEPDYVSITTQHSGCYAHKGMAGGKQLLNLADPDCGEKGTIIHEMMHTIGFAHEQNRRDRDRYVTIRYNKIDPHSLEQFRKPDEEEEYEYDFGYDYSSVMHYGPNAFASSKETASIWTADPYYQRKIGQRAGFSKQDIEQVNKFYECNVEK